MPCSPPTLSAMFGRDTAFHLETGGDRCWTTAVMTCVRKRSCDPTLHLMAWWRQITVVIGLLLMPYVQRFPEFGADLAWSTPLLDAWARSPNP